MILSSPGCPFHSCKKIFPKFKRVLKIFLSPKFFSAEVKRFFVISLSSWNHAENRKTTRVNQNENKENKNVDEFKKYGLQQKPANAKVETQSDMKVWKRLFLKQHKNRELCDELNLLLCKFFKTVKKL